MPRIALSLGLAAIVLAACSQPAPTSTPQSIVDTPTAILSAANPCDKAVLPTTVKDYTDLTREFDDTSYVASFTPQGQLANVILNLQDVRRRVQALDAPDCLKALRKYQVDYMNGVIAALVHFLGGAKGDQVQAEIAATRTLRAKYDKELANVLGITFVAPTAPAQTSPTGTPGAPATTDTNDLAGTPPPDTATAPVDGTATSTELNQTGTPVAEGSPTASTLTATVVQRANLRRGPGTDFALVATLAAKDTATAVGRTASSEWIQVENAAGPDGKAWLLASLVTLNGPIDQLPVVNPP